MSDYFHYQNSQLHAEQVPLTDIAARFGTLLRVFARRAD
jgi:diaminopimelate decarboxylase